MLIGYARVSPTEQDTAMQVDALRKAGCRKIYEDVKSGVARRPQLENLMANLRTGDTVVVFKLDRFARSLPELLRIMDWIEAQQASFKSLTESIDTSTPAGRMAMQMISAVAEFERGIIRERSMAGQQLARERGAQMGRSRALTAEQEHQCIKRFESGKYSKIELARIYGCSVSSIKRTLYRAGLDTVAESHLRGLRTDLPYGRERMAA
jgi:DNA invertase Pin-like site-specific DNA recombinase